MEITLTAAKTDLSLIFGPSYTMEDITVTLPPPPSPTVHLDKLSVAPSFLPLLVRKRWVRPPSETATGKRH